MKIEYNKPDNRFEFINESMQISACKKNILKTKKYSFNHSVKENLLSFIKYVILLVISILFYNKLEGSFMKFVIIFLICCLVVLVAMDAFCLLVNFLVYLISRNKDLSGTISINNDGIEDESNGIKICIKWETISCIIIGKLSFNIFLKEQDNYLCLPIGIKDDLLKIIREYSDVEIIDLLDND